VEEVRLHNVFNVDRLDAMTGKDGALQALAADWQRALRYSTGLPLTTVITGCSTIEQLDDNIDLAENFVPMTGVERLAFFRDILPMVTPQNMPWKSKDWEHKEWVKRREPFGLTRMDCQ
jgi:hypothetical protein